jgi:uncharacterized protein (TIGR02453 family)
VTSPFTRKTLAFLRALKRNNDREWFRARKGDYEAHVRGPMIEVLDRLARDFAQCAPELISEPRVSLFRIYRDTRFSGDKTPLKTHVGAHFPSRRFAKGEGAGLYFEVAPAWVWIGGGIYMPTPEELRRLREHVAAHHRRLHRLVNSPSFRAGAGTLQGERLTRVPRGYPAEHPAADYLRYKQLFVGREYPADFALSPKFYPELLRVFRSIVPLVRFINTAIMPTDRAPAAAPPRL